MKSNKYFEALKKTILFSAVVHLIILLGNAIFTNNLKMLNLFNVLDLELLFPNILNGNFSDISSLAVLIIIYIVFLL